MDTSKILTAAAVVGAIVTLGGFAWAFGESTGYRPWLKKEQDQFSKSQFQLVMEQTQQNTLSIEKGKFDILLDKRKYGELNFDEKVSLCKSAQILEYDVTDEGGRPICTEGQPVIIFKSLK